jgi:hypothetical protein
MKALFVVLLGSLGLQAGEPAPISKSYAEQGELILTQFVTAPFPHPNRAHGHKYKEELLPAADHYSDGTVAIFIPKKFRETGRIDFVVHFHGWRNDVAGVLDRYKLVEQLIESGRNAVLVIPQGPLNAPDSFGGKLEDADGFQRFMGEVAETLKHESNLKKKDFKIGRIVLSGHSGGYQVISSILARGGLTDHIAEVWLFDALYAQTDKFLTWLDKPKRRLINIYTEHGGTKKETEQMMELLKKRGIRFVARKETGLKLSDLPRTGAVFIFTELEHNDVVDKHSTFRDFLKSSVLKKK